MIKLSEVTERDWCAVSGLSVSDEQIRIVAYNSYSLAQARYEFGSKPYSIYHGQKLVGFALIQERDDGVWIVRLMVDHRHQGKGYGRDALKEICRIYAGSRLLTSFVPENKVAARLYEANGFAPTGAIEGGEIVMQREPSESA